MQEIIELIKQFGFPVAVTTYLLISRDKVIKEMTDKLTMLAQAVNNQTLILKERLR